MEIYSWDQDHLSAVDRWFIMAKAYLDCSNRLFLDIETESLSPSFYHALAANFMFTHSVELFLKAGLAQAGKQVQPHHELDELYKQFKNLYPGKKYAFEGKILELIRPDPRRPHGVFPRYPTDRLGQIWPGNTHVKIDVFLEQIRFFAADFDRLETLIKLKYPTT